MNVADRARRLCERPTFELVPAPKVSGKGVHRTVSAETTLARVAAVLETIGVTRLADITGLDRIGIPVYSSIVPDSADILSVYNGKGVTHIDAEAVGAIMEAVERHAATTFDGVDIVASYRQLKQANVALDPAHSGSPVHASYNVDVELPWTLGWDLIASRWLLVPHELAAYGFRPSSVPPCYQVRTTNGLASGNTLEEAICHSLCELIERDAWSLAEILAEWLPLAQRKYGHPNALEGDDLEQFPTVIFDGSATAGRLIARFTEAELRVRLRDLTSNIGIPTILATTAEQMYPDLAMAHFGLGTHPDRDVALVRSLTELAQSRAVDIQGAREDLSSPDAESHPYGAHTKRSETFDPRSWYHAVSTRQRHFNDVATFANANVIDDIVLMIDRMRAIGVDQVVVVDLTRPAVSIPVVRVIVPTLESWAVHHLSIGERAARHWRVAAADSMGQSLGKRVATEGSRR